MRRRFLRAKGAQKLSSRTRATFKRETAGAVSRLKAAPHVTYKLATKSEGKANGLRMIHRVRRTAETNAIPYYKFDLSHNNRIFLLKYGERRCIIGGTHIEWSIFVLGVANNADRRSTLSSLSSYLESNGKGARIWVLKRSSDYLCFSSSLPISSEIGIKMINKNSRQLAILNGYFK